MTDRDLILLALFFIALVILIGAAEFLRKWRHWSQDGARKFVHVLTGILVATTPLVDISKWPMVILGVLFAIANYIAIKRNWLPSMHDPRRRSYGTVFYPMSFVILSLLLWDHNRFILVNAMLIMAVADAVAAIVGERAKNPIYYHLGREKKSIQGSTAMFISSYLVLMACLVLFYEASWSPTQMLWIAGVVAFMATAFEAVSYNGSDNLTVPLGSAFVLHYMMTHPANEGAIFTFGMALALILAAISYRLKFLNASGAIATLLLGTIVFGIGRWTFSVPILTFFILSSLLSKIGKKRKKKIEGVAEKSGARDLWQVLANGGIAGSILLIWYFFPLDVFYLLFAGALAAVTADTWGTEIGMLSKNKPRSIVNFRPVAPGTSGGVSFIGTAGAALGSMVLAGVCAIFGPHASPRIIGLQEFFIIFIAGLAASFVDSYLGALVQAQYRCRVCGKNTEKIIHCRNHPTLFIGGYRWINNDVVNGFAALSGVLIVYLGTQI